jgi:hypothetical protein
MRLHNLRIHITPCAPGMLSVAVMHVVYKHGRVVGNELLFNDWCECDELQRVIGPVLDRAAQLANDMQGGEPVTA